MKMKDILNEIIEDKTYYVPVPPGQVVSFNSAKIENLKKLLSKKNVQFDNGVSLEYLRGRVDNEWLEKILDSDKKIVITSLGWGNIIKDGGKILPSILTGLSRTSYEKEISSR